LQRQRQSPPQVQAFSVRKEANHTVPAASGALRRPIIVEDVLTTGGSAQRR
jgi:orotate phosphoribosyltransferase